MKVFPNALARSIPMLNGARLWPVLMACAIGMVSYGNDVWGAESRSPFTSAAQAQLLVEDTTSRVLAAMSRDREAVQAESALASQVVQSIVMPNVDLKRVSQLVLGKHWRKATKDQQERFMAAFGAQLVRTYVIAVTDYLTVSDKIGVEISYLPVNLSKDKKKALVRSRIGKSSIRVSIDYRLHRVNDTWKVYDVLVEGVSVVSTYRKSYTEAAIKRGIDHVIERIAAQNRKFGPV